MLAAVPVDAGVISTALFVNETEPAVVPVTLTDLLSVVAVLTVVEDVYVFGTVTEPDALSLYAKSPAVPPAHGLPAG